MILFVQFGIDCSNVTYAELAVPIEPGTREFVSLQPEGAWSQA